MDKIKKIVIIFMGGIGNMILFTPALKALKKTFPKASITLLQAENGVDKVISSLIDETIVFDGSLKKKLAILSYLRNKYFDLSITATGINPIKSGFLSFVIGVKYRLGENINNKGFFYNLKVPYENNIHEVEGNLKLVEKLSVNTEDKTLYIEITDKERELAVQFLSANNVNVKDFLIALHPGSGAYQATFRRWAPEKFAELGDKIVHKYKAKIILLGGPKEITLTNHIADLMKNKPINTAGKTTLGEVAALIQKCKLIISNDSGIVHISCAVKTPVVAIFGPTDFRKTGPWSEKALIVRKELACSPCYKRGKVKCEKLECFNSITVENVMSAVKKLMEKYE